MIYLDWNATTPPHADVIAAMREAGTEAWANPASVHRPGQRARAELDRARAAVASLVGMHARDVVLTSGGTEANNLALESGRGGLVVSAIEHPSVVRKAEALAAQGVEVRWVAPEASGVVSVAAFERALEGSVALVSLQAVNHETGVIQPVAEVARLAHARGARMHVDAVQAVGKLAPEAWAGADLVSVAAHKIRGPKGIGALAVLPGVRLQPVLLGGAQERGLRPGTQDATLAAGFAVAAQRAIDGPARYAELESLRDRFERELTAIAARAHIEVVKNGDGPRAPHVSNLSWLGFRGPELCAALDLEGVAVSSGAACSAGTAEPSPVITAMAGEARALSAVRASLGDATRESDIDAALAAFARVVTRS
ncbi:MAG TPA: cysteine desulfurase family protein [Polyangiaceae bacterium]|nr:cysteine desulfurase family protein [Polyangiaceae bacterium]